MNFAEPGHVTHIYARELCFLIQDVTICILDVDKLLCFQICYRIEKI